jgi:tight adherence protein B
MQPAIIRLAVLLGIFASVFIVSQLVLGAAWRHRQKFAAVNARLRMIREGGKRDEILAHLRKNAPGSSLDVPGLLAAPYRAMQRLLFAAAVPLSPQQMIGVMAILFGAIFVLLLAASSLGGFGWQSGVIVLSLAIAASIAIVIPWSLLAIRGQHRRKRIEEQFPVALDVFVRALRSGHPVASAIDLLTHELEDPIGSEFGLVADEVSYGVDLTDALQAMAERWDNGDMRMFVVSLSVQSETGGNLAEILENLADVIRARAMMYMKVRALSSEGRLTAWMLTILPIASFIAMFLVNPGFYLETAQDPIFIFGFGGLILLYLVGLLWIRRMIDLKV